MTERFVSNVEKIKVGARTGTSLSGMVRGQDGTTAVSHSSGETVRHIFPSEEAHQASEHAGNTTLDEHTQYHTAARHAAVVHTAAMFAAPATPVTIQPDAAGSVGSATTFAKADHTHGIGAAAPGSITPDDVAAEGASTSFARADHAHGITAAVANTITPDATPAEGAAASFSRSDHSHGAATATATSITNSNAEGVSTSFARADHNHAYGAASVSEAAIVSTMPRGVIAQQVLTSDSAVFSADATSDLALTNVSVVQNHVYAIHLHTMTRLEPGTIGWWSVSVHANGTSIGRAAELTVNPAQTGTADQQINRDVIDATIYWTAPATQSTDDFDVRVVEQYGSYTLQFIGTPTTPRTFTITDLGVI